MKKPMLFIILQLFVVHAFCAIKTVVANVGTGWGNSTNWSPAGVPVAGDIVLIPAGKIISVKGSFYGTGQDLVIQVYGTLDFDPSGKLNLGNLSSVQLFLLTSSITSNGTSSELITINGTTKYQGSTDGTMSGPKFASAMTGMSPAGFTLGILPARITDFSAIRQVNSVSIRWHSAEESNVRRYVVERSNDLTAWKQIASMIPKGANTRYVIDDAQSTSLTNYYRLRIEDLDFSFTYSKIIKLEIAADAVELKYNVAGNLLNINIAGDVSTSKSISLLDVNGRTILCKKIHTAGRGNIQLDLPHHSSGIYVVALNAGEVKKCFRIFLR